jgi:hypothetical protein
LIWDFHISKGINRDQTIKTTLDQAALAAVQQPAVTPTQTDFKKVKSEAPKKQHQVTESRNPLLFRAVKRDYLEREAQNRSLGLAGEEFVVQFEHWRLIELGQHRLADRVEHVSQSKGDGLGYDVLPFESDFSFRVVNWRCLKQRQISFTFTVCSSLGSLRAFSTFPDHLSNIAFWTR